MKVGVVGCGEIARAHIPFILGETRHTIVGVCDADTKRADELARRCGAGRAYDRLANLLDQQKPDVVHVLTPPQSHAALAVQAMEAGCHVLVEKPMSLSLEEADAMVAASQAHNVKLCVDHNQLFDPVVLEAKKLIADGVLGTVVAVDSHYGFLPSKAVDRRWVENLPGGFFQNLAPHPLYLLLEFLGNPLEMHVSTLTTGSIGPGMPDELRVLMKGKQVIGTLSISLRIKPHVNYLRIYGSNAILNVDLANMMLVLERLRPLPKAVARGLMNVEQGIQLVAGAAGNAMNFILGRLKPYQGIGNLIKEFYKSIENDTAPPVTGQAGRRVVEIMQQIQAKIPVSPSPQPRVHRSGTIGPRVFVTGATGFVGGHLVRRLVQEGAEVRALVRPTSPIGRLKSLGIDCVDGDLTDAKALQRNLDGCEMVYHCAATTKGSWSEYVEGTIQGTERILEASSAAGVKTLVYISSLSVYGVSEFKDHDMVTEDSPYEPRLEERGYYTHSKVEAEKLVRRYARERGLRTTILRPGTIYGPGGKVFFPRIGFNLKNKLFFIIGHGNHELPLAYIENVVDAICLAGIRDEATGQIYNIVDDERLTQLEYVKKLKKMAGIDAYTVRVPFGFLYMATSMVELIAALAGKKRLPITRYKLACNTKDLRYSTDRAKDHLQWKPVVSLEEGLRRTFEWYRSGRLHR